MPRRQRIIARLHGPMSLKWDDGTDIDLRGAKNRALFAILALSPEGKRSRTFLQQTLWGRAGPEQGRPSLRSALLALRRALGPDADALITSTKSDITLDRMRVDLVGGPESGALLEGVDLPEPGFVDWVSLHRGDLAPGQVRDRESLRPTIAILPFVAVERDGSGMQLGDLLAQEVTRSLARSRMLDVISHLSSRAVSPRTIDLSSVRASLGCDYAVNGLFRSSGDHFQVDVELVDSATGKIRWTDSFADRIDRLLSGESEVILAVAQACGQVVVRQAVELALSRPLPEAPIHALIMSGVSLMHEQAFLRYSLARDHIEAAIERAPRRAELLGWLAKWYGLNVSQGWSTDPAKDARMAEDLTLRALEIEPDDSFALTMNAYVNNNLLQRFDDSMSQFEQALRMEPNNALALLLKGTLHAFMDEGGKAVELCGQARSLSPLDPHSYFFDTLCATAHLAQQNYEQALVLADRSREANNRHISTHRVRTIALQALGRKAEAAQALQTLMRLRPNFTIDGYLASHPAAHFSNGRQWADLLAAAGAP